jgi:hypothetical protein
MATPNFKSEILIYDYQEALRYIEKNLKEGKTLTGMHVFVGPEIEIKMKG